MVLRQTPAVDSGGALVRQGVRLGVITPVATQVPGAHAGWEAEAGIEEMARIAETADRLGFDHLTCSEHVAVPPEDAAVRGGTYWDPLATLGYLAARTERIRLATYVLVLGYHHPLAIAKRYGTLDRVSGGRLVLGVGVGTLQAEFELLDAPFDDRGTRADDTLRTLRRVWGRREVELDGSWVVEPHAANPETPIWVGGRTRRSLRRAIELAHGWAPFWLKVDDAASWLGAVDLPAGFEVVAQPGATIDPSGDPDAVDALLARWAQAGATVVDLHVVHHSLDHYLEQLEALAA